ncbi:putative Intraflagellar transport protein 52 [Paratrimastix pyriformis]|uniref:Intraflagellar transport protein 52 n=1 Tax=Paratrimastix pyriformis TaxID=342808 RepID=A0ABQ8UAJ7_9EUKA|nr:putative Intraflagellar transport protein 52 [Paratrimastix pyriformis]
MQDRTGSATPPSSSPAAPGSSIKNVLIDQCKREVTAYKLLSKSFRSNFRFTSNKDDLTADRLSGVNVLILGGPRDKFTTGEVETLKRFIESGGSVLVAVGEGGEQRLGTNINYFLEEFGIAVNRDSVIRASYKTYAHPKEALISDGVLNREINRAAGKKVSTSAVSTRSAAQSGEVSLSESSLTFVFPYGATLSVQKPAVPILSTGDLCFPMHRPIAAVYKHPQTSGGRIAVVGSVHLMDDAWLNKEENAALVQILLKWLVGSPDVALNAIDAEEPDVADYHFLPDTGALAENVKCCLQEGQPLPVDFTQLFDQDLCKFDTSMIPEALALYGKLDLKHEQLSLIPPQARSCPPCPAPRPSIRGLA